MRLLWVVVVLVILLLGGLTGYAYFGDMSAAPRETRLPVQLDLGSEPAPAPVVGQTTPEPAPAEPAPAEAPAATEQDDLD
ncbi:hypothetical protein ACEUZ9_002069 [Paracoccus litorisediminis]|uniref:Uncharacterized protein n=1 Tax=Paracoccus litorisediminis TaxID=2006130 RepID=A0A844HQA8_9RHOB|nr:hypothetical protein [Paracoccus litorisediminis]MTH59871.1 hypothetical protein [Paracoccus litorisediminis]